MGQPARKMEELLDATTRSQVRAVSTQTVARADAIRTIRELESRVQTSLDGGTLRGLSSLVSDEGVQFQAARVNGGKRFGIDAYLPIDGREVLVLNKNGRLQMAHVLQGQLLSGERWSSRDIRDDELQAQDLEPIVVAVQQALERHIMRAERTAKSYERIQDLSARIASAVGFQLP